MKLNIFGMYVNFALITICFIYLKWYGMCIFYFKFLNFKFEKCFLLQV
jgi:hypothetical protein